MTTRKGKPSSVSKTAENGHTDAKGRFLPGNPGGPGRPRGSTAFEVRVIAREWAEREGIDLSEAIWKVINAMLKLGAEGDTRAAQIVLERLCPEAKKVEVEGEFTLAEILAGVDRLRREETEP